MLSSHHRLPSAALPSLKKNTVRRSLKRTQSRATPTAFWPFKIEIGMSHVSNRPGFDSRDAQKCFHTGSGGSRV